MRVDNLQSKKIAIHHREGSFSDRWINYCRDENIPYKIVDCYSTGIITDLDDCDILMWHWHHGDPKAALFARQLTYSLECIGKKVFPDANTAWHFDDKLGQKYLLEAVGAPFIKSYVFYDKKESLAWAEKADYPKVFKLRGGAGSANVKLIKSPGHAKNLIDTAFGTGFERFDRVGNLKEHIRRYKEGKGSILGIIKGVGRLWMGTSYAKMAGKERGYFYVQDFIANNKSDIRIVVVGNKGFALERFVRDNDFRASGSGRIKYLDDSNCDKNCLHIAFETSRKLKTSCLAYDFIYNENGEPLIVEISYAFAMKAYDACEGYWDADLNWVKGKFNPQNWMVEGVMNG